MRCPVSGISTLKYSSLPQGPWLMRSYPEYFSSSTKQLSDNEKYIQVDAATFKYGYTETESCHDWWYQWWQIWHHDHSLFSVFIDKKKTKKKPFMQWCRHSADCKVFCFFTILKALLTSNYLSSTRWYHTNWPRRFLNLEVFPGPLFTKLTLLTVRSRKIS